MTYDQLEKANNIREKIMKLERFRDALHSPYFAEVAAHDWRGDKDVTQRLDVESNGKLFQIIDDYIKDQVDSLEKEFEMI